MSFKIITLFIMAALYIVAGLNHFYMPNFYLKMMPPFLPAKLLLVQLSGFFEIALGVLLIFESTRKWAAVGIILLLIAVFPANIYMYQQGSQKFGFSDWGLLLRLPLQFALMAWAYAYV